MKQQPQSGTSASPAADPAHVDPKGGSMPLPRAEFAELCRAYRPRVYALALQITGSRSDADDVTQETFLLAHDRLGSLRDRGALFTWLYRITLNQALSLHRSRSRQQRWQSEAWLALALQADADDDPRTALELRESYTLLLEALSALSPTLRTTVLLIVLHGLSYRQAAEVLDTSEGTVAWRVHEARAQLRAYLERAERGRNAGPALCQSRAGQLLRRLLSLAPLPPASPALADQSA